MSLVGKSVLYTLSANDAVEINRRREHYGHFLNKSSREVVGEGVLTGHQSHVGNRVSEGEQYPAVVVRVFSPEQTTANLQVHLDGSDTFWATSRQLGEGPSRYQLGDY